MTISFKDVFATPDEIIPIKVTILVVKVSIITPKRVNIIIHFIIRYSMKQYIDNNIDLLCIFSVCINKYILFNVGYNI